ncbi:MAG: alpha-mannosidase [Dysgonamonadaceae bacterium]|jgi:alpha-mannosidase|nr:alpha-mannosidase [Dysgonamonadaceae bacterium]
MNKFYFSLLVSYTCLAVHSQKAFFVDGYHGGIYGHYPVQWKTQFIVDQLALHPEWRICMEIEPETWDTVRVKTPNAYQKFKQIAAGKQVEFTNPAYAQPYCYNISGESIIRQFQYGMEKIKQHFPEVDFTTYSVEEPCFSSCLPQILKSFGFKYAVLKNPNTCWGGYTQNYGGEIVKWIGPDGSSILTVPRYACEELEKNSTWQTTAWNNSDAYLQACNKAGIRHPVGMCFQDAGWKNGPWIGSGRHIKNNSVYVTWRDYIENNSIGKTDDIWHFSQEDLHVNLMWGSQTLQRIAQQVRSAENRVVMAEKISVIAYAENGYRYPQNELDEAWRTLMLAQHHDSWIVPYNRLNKQHTWAEEIERWTAQTNAVTDRIIEEAIHYDKSKEMLHEKSIYIRIYNTLSFDRNEVVNLLLPPECAATDMALYDSNGQEIRCSVEQDNDTIRLFFVADAPAFGYSTYSIRQGKSSGEEVSVNRVDESEGLIENDMYKIVFDLSKGGRIKKLIAKKENNKDFAAKNSPYALGELRGYFYDEAKFCSSSEAAARMRVVKNNPYEIKVQIDGEIASHPFTQWVRLVKGQKRIDFELAIHWKNNAGIGEYREKNWRANRRAYCDDRFKLNVLFPADLRSPRIYKDAPFDVCESRLDNTFFQTWDGIKHNIILHWVDLAEQDGDYALALLSDHTTSYSYGEDFPLGLTAQYSGIGLWGMDYKITQPLKMKYALVPHRGKWDEAAVSACSDSWNEPLVCAYIPRATVENKSLITFSKSGYQITAAQIRDDGKIVLRLFNADGDNTARKITFALSLLSVKEIDLNGNVIERKKLEKHSGKTDITVSMPRFGIRTFLLETN